MTETLVSACPRCGCMLSDICTNPFHDKIRRALGQATRTTVTDDPETGEAVTTTEIVGPDDSAPFDYEDDPGRPFEEPEVEPFVEIDEAIQRAREARAKWDFAEWLATTFLSQVPPRTEITIERGELIEQIRLSHIEWLQNLLGEETLELPLDEWFLGPVASFVSDLGFNEHAETLELLTRLYGDLTTTLEAEIDHS